MSALTEGSLCTGYDGLTMGLRLALPGTEIVTRWQAEDDDDMSTVLAKHHPGTPNLGDITLADFAAQPPVDIIAAGFPCQPVSAAGRQKGDADVRWLWPDVHRAILAQRPGAVFLENVMNLVSWQGGRLLRVILDDLRAAGYRSRWTVLGACAVGAPHHRHRWFLVAGYVGPHAPAPERIDRKALCGAPRTGGRALLPSPTASDDTGPGHAAQGGRNLRTTIADLLPTPRASDGEKGRGNPNQRYGSGSYGLGAVAGPLLPTPLAADAERGSLTMVRGNHTLRGVAQPERWGKFAEAVALWESITGIPAPEPTIPAAKSDGRRLSPLLPEWMMGLPPGRLTDILGRSPAIKGAGNGVVPLQAAAAWRLLTC